MGKTGVAVLPTRLPTEKLSAREIEILKLVARGCYNKQIAAALGITDQSTKSHLTNIFIKLQVGNRAAAAVRAIQLKVIPFPKKGEYERG